MKVIISFFLLFSSLISSGQSLFVPGGFSSSGIGTSTTGNVGIGTSEPSETLHVNGTLGIGKFESTSQSGLKIEYSEYGGSGTSVFKLNRWGYGFYFKRNSASGERTQVFFGGLNNHHMDIYNGNDEVKVRFNTSGDSYLNGGNLGIGTNSPRALFDVGAFINGGVLGSVMGRLSEGNGAGAGTYLGVRGYATQQYEYGGKSFALEHSFYGVVNSSINFYRGGGVGGGFLTFNTQENVERMRLTGDGNLAIGTVDPRGYKLAVAGKTITEEVVVSLQGNWPDYVFEKPYKLPSLSELEQFILANKHLPEVPTAEDVKERGLSLGEMNAVLLKKIEELTLYLIQQDAKINELQGRLSTIEQK